MRAVPGVSFRLRADGSYPAVEAAKGTEDSSTGELLLSGVGSLTPGYWPIAAAAGPAARPAPNDAAGTPRKEERKEEATAVAGAISDDSGSGNYSRSGDGSGSGSGGSGSDGVSAGCGGANKGVSGGCGGGGGGDADADVVRLQVGPTREWATGDVFEWSVSGWLTHACRRDELLLHTSGEMTNPLIIERLVLQVKDTAAEGRIPNPGGCESRRVQNTGRGGRVLSTLVSFGCHVDHLGSFIAAGIVELCLCSLRVRRGPPLCSSRRGAPRLGTDPRRGKLVSSIYIHIVLVL